MFKISVICSYEEKNLSLDKKMKVIKYANKKPKKGCRKLKMCCLQSLSFPTNDLLIILCCLFYNALRPQSRFLQRNLYFWSKMNRFGMDLYVAGTFWDGPLCSGHSLAGTFLWSRQCPLQKDFTVFDILFSFYDRQ